MKKLLAILLFALPLSGYSQSIITFCRNDTKADKIVLVPPVTFISVISKGSNQQIDSGLTRETFRNTLAQLQNSFPDSVKTSLFYADTSVQSKLASFIKKLNSEIRTDRQARKYTIPDSVLALFDTSKANYIFCTYNAGFKRTRNNLVNTHLTTEVVDLLIGFPYRPLESASLMSCFIIDLREKNILYFERNLWEHKDPTDIKTIELQLRRLVIHHFI